MAENTKKWAEIGRRYRTYIRLEKGLADNTVEAYMRDLAQFAHFVLRQWDVAPRKVEREMVERYLEWLYERGRDKSSQARQLSGVRSFFNFMLLEERIDAMQEAVPAIDKFTLPGGHEVVSLCHVCRTVCRRAERAALRADQTHGVDAATLRWLNRLSDYFYLLGRLLAVRYDARETLWIP